MGTSWMGFRCENRIFNEGKEQFWEVHDHDKNG